MYDLFQRTPFVSVCTHDRAQLAPLNLSPFVEKLLAEPLDDPRFQLGLPQRLVSQRIAGQHDRSGFAQQSRDFALAAADAADQADDMRHEPASSSDVVSS